MVLWLKTIGVASLLAAAAPTFAEMSDLVTFPLTIPPGTEAFVLEVEAGPRSGEAELVLETTDGALVGAISTFGFKGILPAGSPQISVRRKPELSGDLEITGKIVQFGQERPATADELRGVRLVLP